jgi:capsular exopolysaccharide synthesis family protein
MKPLIKPQQTLRDIDFNYYIRHYLNLLWRWKLYIIISGPLVAVLCIVYTLKFGTIQPAMPATAVVGLENTSNISAVQDLNSDRNVRSPAREKAELIKSRSIIGAVVDRLSLRLIVDKEFRSSIFDSVRVDTTAIPGKYKFSLSDNKETYNILFLNKRLGFNNKLIYSGPIATLDTLLLPGVRLKFNGDFFKHVHSFSFFIVRQRDAVNKILSKLVTSAGREDEASNHFSITLTGTDYPLITQTVNAIVDEFVDKNLNFRKRKTQEIIGVLEKQLAAAAAQLATSEEMLRNFHDKNPNMGLTDNTQQTVSNISQLETNHYLSRNDLLEADRILKRYESSNDDDREFSINEMLGFLSSHQVSVASALQMEYTQLVQNKTNALQLYAKGHPIIATIDKKIKDLGERTAAKLVDYQSTSQTEISAHEAQIESLNRRMQQLPSQELRLAELTRQQQISSQIHSQVLNRYNQAKISDAVEVTDMNVMDYAVVPEAYSDFINVLIRMAIGIGIGIAVSLAPPIGFDLLDKTARTTTDLQRLISLPILEAIPEITDEKKKKNKTQKKEPTDGSPPLHYNPMLITTDYAPNYINELFRSLRAKIMLRLQKQTVKKLVICSHGASEGKSTISSNLAITTAQQKLKTILIDGDIRKGVLHSNFMLPKGPGLSDILFSENPLTPETIAPFCKPTHVPNLHIVSSGPNVPNPTELLSSPRFGAFIDLLSQFYNVIIMDSPPIGIVSDVVLMQSSFDSFMFVVKAGSTNIIDLKKKIEEYPEFDKKIIGLVLNMVSIDNRLKYYKYSHYHY